MQNNNNTPPLGRVFVRAQRRQAKFHGLTRRNGVDFGRGMNFRRLLELASTIIKSIVHFCRLTYYNETNRSFFRLVYYNQVKSYFPPHMLQLSQQFIFVAHISYYNQINSSFFPSYTIIKSKANSPVIC